MPTRSLASAEWDAASMRDTNVILATIGIYGFVWVHCKVEQVHEAMVIPTGDWQCRRIRRVNGDMTGYCDNVALVNMNGRARVVRVDAHVETDIVTLLVAGNIVGVGTNVGITRAVWDAIYRHCRVQRTSVLMCVCPRYRPCEWHRAVTLGFTSLIVALRPRGLFVCRKILANVAIKGVDHQCAHVLHLVYLFCVCDVVDQLIRLL